MAIHFSFWTTLFAGVCRIHVNFPCILVLTNIVYPYLSQTAVISPSDETGFQLNEFT